MKKRTFILATLAAVVIGTAIYRSIPTYIQMNVPCPITLERKINITVTSRKEDAIKPSKVMEIVEKWAKDKTPEERKSPRTKEELIGILYEKGIRISGPIEYIYEPITTTQPH